MSEGVAMTTADLARSAPRAQRLSLVDTAWLHMEMPTNLMMVGSIAFFDEPLDRDVLATTLRRRLLVHPRFLERIDTTPLRGPRWVPDEAFNLDDHIHRVALPAPGGDAELRELTSDLMSHPLDMERPLWDAYVVEGYGRGSVFFTRIHHSVADGTALIQVLLGLTGSTAEESLRAPRRRPHHREEQRGIRLPSLDPRDAVRGVVQAGAQMYTLARMTALFPDSRSPLRGTLVRSKRVAWTEPFPLSTLKPLRAATGYTVNDVLVAAVTGALRAHIRRRQETVPDHIRALVPVDMRPDPTDNKLGNQFGLVFLDMPVGISNRRERLDAVHERMAAARNSPQPSVAFEVLGALGLTPQMLQRQVVRFFGSKGTAVVTNVRGPAEELYLAGHKLRRITFFVPQSAGLGMGISIFTYAGRIEMGVIADAGLVPDPTAIARDITTELRRLVGR
jgi:WS/DGAT/MGAT family acyltransferase